MIAIIVGLTKNRIIGKNNDLPWKISEDLKNFKKHTAGQTIIMGRKTYESIGRPLPNRHNIVISRNMQEIEGVDICSSIEEATKKAKEYEKDIFIIGGSTIYKQFLPIVDKLYLSWINKDYDGDTYFPEFNLDEWQEEHKEEFEEFNFIIYNRK